MAGGQGNMRNLLSALMAITVLVCGCIYLPGCTAAKNPPVITSFNASPASIDPGGSATLSWAVTGAKSVSLDNGIGNVAVKGTRAVVPSAATVYVLTASNAAGSTTASTQVLVSGTGTGTGAAPSPEPSSTGILAIGSFSASPGSITAGASSTLSWNVANATSVNIQPGIGNVAASGSTAVTPGSSTEYILTATSSSGSSQASTQVIVSSGTTDTSTGATTPTIPAMQFIPATPFVTPQYDFITNAPEADWATDTQHLTFPGSQGDNKGYVLVLNNATLEDSQVYKKVLETHPQYDLPPDWRTFGSIWSKYYLPDTYTIQANDHFYAKVGFLKGATVGDVTFKVIFQDFRTMKTYNIASVTKRYDGTLTTIDVPLTDCAGKKCFVNLRVEANKVNATQDWAVWVTPRIVR
jgi:hypothetical protein